ncbi:MAG: cyclopropane-fatty-acyl-phospholipid synthase family protein [Pseudomonadota bacterium]
MWERFFDFALRRMIKIGALTVVFPSGRVRTYGDGSSDQVKARLHDRRSVRRLVLNPELAFGESYTDATLTIENDDLRGLFRVILQNKSAGTNLPGQAVIQKIRSALRWISQHNPIGRAQANVAHHYDLSDALYEMFLDEDRQYSCAYFRTPDDTLEQAQAQKKAHIAGKLLIEPGMRVLDIGCGWGGMALTLARDYGAQVVGVTLSEEQYKIARARVSAAGLDDQIDIRLMDYRALDDRFDRIVSVGMFEHVGVPHYNEYFAKVRGLLTEEGVALIHTIGRTIPPSHTNAWIAKYIFPGGYCPSMSEVLRVVEQEDLYPCDIEVWRLHYAETLRHWHQRFSANRARIKALYDERFCRMWSYYLLACEMTFRHHHQCVFQFQLTRLQDAVPLTRDYLYRAAEGQPVEHAHAAE